MKSRVNAATEHVKNNYFPENRLTAKSAFLAGVDFAETWIPVEDELPAADILNAVIVKLQGKRLIADIGYQISLFDIRTQKFSDIKRYEKVTHWRYINIK